jgi:hypothetical protein
MRPPRLRSLLLGFGPRHRHEARIPLGGRDHGLLRLGVGRRGRGCRRRALFRGWRRLRAFEMARGSFDGRWTLRSIGIAADLLDARAARQRRNGRRRRSDAIGLTRVLHTRGGVRRNRTVWSRVPPDRFVRL